MSTPMTRVGVIVRMVGVPIASATKRRKPVFAQSFARPPDGYPPRMTNPHDETTGYEIDPRALAVNSEDDRTRMHGNADETERVQTATGAIAPVPDEEDSGTA